MHKLLLLFTFVIVVIAGCNNDTNNVDIKEKSEKLNAFLGSFDTSAQFFKVAFNTQSVIRGIKGTEIYINPADLEGANGKQITDSINIELKELTNCSEFLRANTQTVSNGKLLVSGGAYYINLTAGGMPLKLKNAKTLKVSFPKITEMPMSIFYGQRDSMGNMNWQASSDNLTSKETILSDSSQEDHDTTLEKTWHKSILYEAMYLKSLDG